MTKRFHFALKEKKRKAFVMKRGTVRDRRKDTSCGNEGVEQDINKISKEQRITETLYKRKKSKEEGDKIRQKKVKGRRRKKNKSKKKSREIGKQI